MNILRREKGILLTYLDAETIRQWHCEAQQAMNNHLDFCLDCRAESFCPVGRELSRDVRGLAADSREMERREETAKAKEA